MLIKRNEVSNRRGFTLIELLVVIAIIGLLAAVVLASLNTARAKARDARRASDVKQIRMAIEMYRDSTGGIPLSTGGSDVCLGVASGGSCWGGDAAGSTALTNALAPYLSSIPTDPDPNRFYGAYTYASPGSYWETAVGTVTGNASSFSVMWVPEKGATVESCTATGGIYGKWVGNCPSGGSCRQCGIIVQ